MDNENFWESTEFIDGESSSDRNYVIDKAVRIEDYISKCLSFALDLESQKDSKSFGETSAALNFSNKINLLLDLKILDKTQKLKVTLFSEIRNRFAHNLSCTTFKIAYTKDIANSLVKFYGSSIDAGSGVFEELQLFTSLYIDLKLILDVVRTQIYGRKLNLEILQVTAAIAMRTIELIHANPGIYDSQKINQLNDIAREEIMKKAGISKTATFKTSFTVNWGKAFDPDPPLITTT